MMFSAGAGAEEAVEDGGVVIAALAPSFRSILTIFLFLVYMTSNAGALRRAHSVNDGMGH